MRDRLSKNEQQKQDREVRIGRRFAKDVVPKGEVKPVDPRTERFPDVRIVSAKGNKGVEIVTFGKQNQKEKKGVMGLLKRTKLDPIMKMPKGTSIVVCVERRFANPDDTARSLSEALNGKRSGLSRKPENDIYLLYPDKKDSLTARVYPGYKKY